jgi:Rrf2 family iron-sulfur cluster assembly transcriptional regulator
MIGLSKKTIFALETVLDIACHEGGNPARSGDINKRQGIPKRYLESVLQELVRSGVLKGIRGPRGGYRVGRGPKEITLADIDEAVERTQIRPTIADAQPISRLGQEIVMPMLTDLSSRWTQQLQNISIETLTKEARKVQG